MGPPTTTRCKAFVLRVDRRSFIEVVACLSPTFGAGVVQHIELGVIAEALGAPFDECRLCIRRLLRGYRLGPEVRNTHAVDPDIHQPTALLHGNRRPRLKRRCSQLRTDTVDVALGLFTRHPITTVTDGICYCLLTIERSSRARGRRKQNSHYRCDDAESNLHLTSPSRVRITRRNQPYDATSPTRLPPVSDSGATDPWGNPTTGPPPPGWQTYDQAQPPGAPGFQNYGPPRTEGTAIGSLVCAVVGLLLCGIILEPVAIILGFQARKKIRTSNGALKGEGLALAGIVIGFVGLALAIVGIIILVNNPDFIDNLVSTTTSTAG